MSKAFGSFHNPETGRDRVKRGAKKGQQEKEKMTVVSEGSRAMRRRTVSQLFQTERGQSV